MKQLFLWGGLALSLVSCGSNSTGKTGIPTDTSSINATNMNGDSTAAGVNINGGTNAGGATNVNSNGGTTTNTDGSVTDGSVSGSSQKSDTASYERMNGTVHKDSTH